MSEPNKLSDASSPDVIVIGSGIGGATFAAALAPTGARIVILERGEQLQDTAEARDARAIFQRGFYRPTETWTDGSGQPFNPGNYYYVGGNSKFYGAVLIRYRACDFSADRARRGDDPGLAVRLRRTGAVVHPGRAALSRLRRAR